MQIRNMTQADLVKATGLSKPRISQYVNGTYEAKQQALYALAEALNVNISWLMGNDVPMEIDYEKLHQEVNACELIEKAYGKEAFELIRSYLELDQADREKFMEAFSMYTQLNPTDQGKIRVEMKQMLWAKKCAEPQTHLTKIAARNGKFEERAMTDSELNAIMSLPDVDDLQ